jgi:GT2 family glycosyltransferase
MFETSKPNIDTAASAKAVIKVGIITVTYNSGSVIDDLFRSLEWQTHSNFVLYVVDNASTDSTLEKVQGWNDPRLVLISNVENVGIARANNQGVFAALAEGCDTVLFLNNDVVFGADLLSTLADGLVEHSCDITVPLIYFHDRPNTIWSAGGRFQSFFGYQSRHVGEGDEDIGQYDVAQAIEFAPGCCILVRRSVFDQIGLLDEHYFVYSEDVDFMYRALQAGVRAFLIPHAKLWHKVSTLTGGSRSNFTLYYSSRGRELFLTKHFGVFFGGMWALFYFIFYPFRSLFGLDTWKQSLTRVKGILEGYRVGREVYGSERL